MKVEKNMGKKKRKRKGEREERTRDTVCLIHFLLYCVLHALGGALGRLRSFLGVLELSLCPCPGIATTQDHSTSTNQMSSVRPLHMKDQSPVGTYMYTTQLSSQELWTKWHKACESAEEQQFWGSNSHYPMPPEWSLLLLPAAAQPGMQMP